MFVLVAARRFDWSGAGLRAGPLCSNRDRLSQTGHDASLRGCGRPVLAPGHGGTDRRDATGRHYPLDGIEHVRQRRAAGRRIEQAGDLVRVAHIDVEVQVERAAG